MSWRGDSRAWARVGSFLRSAQRAAFPHAFIAAPFLLGFVGDDFTLFNRWPAARDETGMHRAKSTDGFDMRSS
uniref:Uncharacterized protein n=1 Tax=mine drainage metagenome TaxID=410659 RepID=E6PK46_9ZZZZ